jgi:hypothetical protein
MKSWLPDIAAGIAIAFFIVVMVAGAGWLQP